MSGFSIKKTHKYLETTNNQQVQQTSSNTVDVLALFNSESKTTLDTLLAQKAKQNKNPVSGPTVGSDVGISIKNIPSAQADYM